MIAFEPEPQEQPVDLLGVVERTAGREDVADLADGIEEHRIAGLVLDEPKQLRVLMHVEPKQLAPLATRGPEIPRERAHVLVAERCDDLGRRLFLANSEKHHPDVLQRHRLLLVARLRAVLVHLLEERHRIEPKPAARIDVQPCSVGAVHDHRTVVPIEVPGEHLIVGGDRFPELRE